MTEYTTRQEAQIARENSFSFADYQDKLAKLNDDEAKQNIDTNEVGFNLMRKVTELIIEHHDEYLSHHRSDVLSTIYFLGREHTAELFASHLIRFTAKNAVRQDLNRELMERLYEIHMEKVIKDAMRSASHEGLEGKELNRERESVIKSFDYELKYSKDTHVIGVLLDKMSEYQITAEVSANDCLTFAQKYVTQIIADCALIEENTEDLQNIFMQFSQEAQDTIEDLKEFIARHSVTHRPMVCQPRQWKSVHRGGYYTRPFQSPLVKNISVRDADYVCQLENNPKFENFLNAVNHIQNTAFVVNQDVYDLVQDIVEAGGNMCDIPSQERTSVAAGCTGKELNRAIKKEASRKSKVDLVDRVMVAAKDFKDEEEIYLVYDVDFRGRVYCKCSTLTPQGTDLQKALLLFSKGMKLGKEGHRWLKIHAANCYAANALDKAPMNTRVKWVNKNMENLKIIAEGDINNKQFQKIMKKADSPLLLFAVARELVELDGKTKDEIENFESRIPISIDGSNNGLQHYAAILRSTLLAEKVNLHVLGNADTPSDVYAKVAEGATEYFETHTATYIREQVLNTKAKRRDQIKLKTVKELQKAWLDASLAVRRKTVKRPTMTQAYSVTKSGARDQMKEDAMDKYKLSDDAEKFFGTVIGAGFDAGLDKHCSAAVKGMDFLKAIAKSVPGELTWTTPMGFTVRQQYNKIEKFRVHSTIGKKKTSIQYDKYTDEINTNKQKSAIAPNFIHSHDSAHMLKVVEDTCSKEDFIPAFFMIHDSFGTYAGQAETLSVQTRNSFVDMYTENDVFKNLQDAAEEQGATNVPPLPVTPKEDLFDLEDVRKATYFFC